MIVVMLVRFEIVVLAALAIKTSKHIAKKYNKKLCSVAHCYIMGAIQTSNTEGIIMNKQIEFKKLALIKVPEERQEEEGCVAFQMVMYTIRYFDGAIIEGWCDTKIGFDGVQRVFCGDGFFEDGKAIA